MAKCSWCAKEIDLEKINMKFKLIKEMLKENGNRILFEGNTTDKEINFYGWGDENKSLKFILCKGFIDDWCIYLETMDRHMTFEEVKSWGNKISPEKALILIDCNSEVLERYRL